uniref:hydroxymethylbilane synthase n=1 Tax=Taenia asiatica TaxID=60517 RepID=A0A0R3W2K4_TAEAS
LIRPFRGWAMALACSSVIRVGSRESQLALLQTDFVINLLQQRHPQCRFEVVKISTTGDKILDKELSKIGDKSLFTKELEFALLNGTVDFVVHSLKDVPTTVPDGLILGCICPRAPPFDVVLMSPSNRGKKLAELPPNSIIGTSALRRIAVLKRRFPHLNFISVRGNLSTRLQKLDGPCPKEGCSSITNPMYDALILAEAGILRVGWELRIDEHLDRDRYAVGQGALACECRFGDSRIQSLLSSVHCETTALACIAERAFMSRLEGSCTTPIAVRTELSPGGVAGVKSDGIGPVRFLCLDAAVLSLDGTKCVEGKLGTSLPFSMPSDCAKLREVGVRPLVAGCPTLDDAITESEESFAKDEKAVFLGVQVAPIPPLGRIRMARARRLGESLADRLYVSGAAEILTEIRASATSVQSNLESRDTDISPFHRDTTNTTTERAVATTAADLAVITKMDKKSKNKRKAFYRRCAAGERRAKQRLLEASGSGVTGAPSTRRLEPGMTGILLTFNNKEERQALTEAYRLLNEAHKRLNGTHLSEEKADSVSDENDLDISLALVEEMKSGFTTSQYTFYGVKTGVSNCAFVLNQSADSSSADLVYEVFRHVIASGEANSRRVLRFQPVMATCRPDKDDLRILIHKAWKVFWKGANSFEDGKPLCLLCSKVPLQRVKFVKKDDNGDAKKYFTVNFRARNYGKMSKVEAVMVVIAAMQEVAPDWSPVRAGADLVISVDVLCTVLCLSFLEKFSAFAKYNISELTSPSS